MKRILLTVGIMLFFNIVTVMIIGNIYSNKISRYESNKNDVIQNEIKNLKEDNSLLKNQLEETSALVISLEKQSQKDNETILSLEKDIQDLQKENSSLKNQLSPTLEQQIDGNTSTPTPLPTPIENDKIAYLTFDDGPSLNTLKILETLDNYNVKATFFVTGGTSDFYKNTIKDISNRGHAIGNHTYSHEYKSIYASVDAFKNDFKKNEDNLYSILGYRPEVLRFPGGSNNKVSHPYGGSTIMKQIINNIDTSKYQYFDWNVSSTDAEVITQDKNKIINSVTNEAKNKKNIIILFHDSKPKTTTAEALPTIIENLKSMGFQFKTLDKNSYTIQFEK